MAGRSTDPGRSVTSRALDLLGAFDAEHTRLPLSELSRRAGLPPATAHRLAGDLVLWGALDRDEDGGYRVGLRLWRTGLLAPVSDGLRETVLPFMQDLYEATRENIHLAVREGDEALYVEKLSGHRSVPVLSRVGARLPLHATGVGKALLAWAEPEVVHAYCDRPLTRHTRRTIIERGRLLRELRSAVERGYASTVEEMSLGSCSVAVPVRVGEGPPVAALGIVVHTVRADLVRLVPALRTAAEGASRRLAAAPGT